MIGLALIIISILIIGIWVLVELRRMKHKLWAIFLICLVLFSYISFSLVLKGQDIDYKSVGGLIQAGKIYFSWLGGVFGNVKTITGSAVDMDWGVNESNPE